MLYTLWVNWFQSFVFIAITTKRLVARPKILWNFNNLIMSQFIARWASVYPQPIHTTHNFFLWRQGDHQKHYHSLQWFSSYAQSRLPGHRRKKVSRTNRKIYCPLMATLILNASIKCDYLCDCELYQKYSFCKQKSGDGSWEWGARLYKTLIFAEWFYFERQFFYSSFLKHIFLYFDFFSLSIYFWTSRDADKITMLRMMLSE